MGGENTQSAYDLNDQNLYNQEWTILKMSGLLEDQIERKNIVVDNFKGEDVYYRTHILGDKSKQKLVLVHGYGGSDMIGMGASSRPENFDYQTMTPQQCSDYFVEYFEKWRVAMDLTDFHLVGHSFGGYHVGLYACKYPQHIKKLVLASPIGVSVKSTELLPEPTTFRAKMRRSLANLVISKHISPFSAMRTVGKTIALSRLNKYVDRAQKTQSPEERQAVVEFMYQIFMRKGTTEHALTVFFGQGFQPHISLSLPNMMADPNFPLTYAIFFGDSDWVRNMDNGDSKKLVDNCTNPESIYQIIPNSGHNLHMANPYGFVNAVVNFTESMDLPLSI